jgi:hypothetical protein
MCWNENISLNTFIFTTAVMIFIWYNNTYTQYKLKEFTNWIAYFLFFSITSMQLIEYFLWKSINEKNKFNNTLFSILGWVVIRIIQPLFIILIIPDKYSMMRKMLFILYYSLLVMISVYKYFYNPFDFTTTIDKNGHLLWKWLDLKNFELIIGYFYLFLFTTLLLSYPVITIIFGAMFLYCYFNYHITWSSQWCWVCNSVLLYFLIKILFIMPYKEYKMLC